MLCIEDIKPAEMIQFLREAGIGETASPDVSQHGGATHETERPKMLKQEPRDPLDVIAETDDESLGAIGGEATPDDAQTSKKSKHAHQEELNLWDSLESPDGPVSDADDYEKMPDEQVNEEYLDLLYEAHVRRERQRLSFPAFKAHTIPTTPREAV